MYSALVYVGYTVYPSSCNVFDVSLKAYLELADQMHTCTSVSVRFPTSSEGKMPYTL